VAATLSALGTAYQGRGELTRAKACFQRAVGILETTSPQDSDLGLYRCKLGWVYLDEGDVSRAGDAFSLALREQEAALGSDHPDLWITLRGLAMVARKHGEGEAARRYYERTLELVRRSGPNHPDLGQTLAEYASFRLAISDTLGAMDTAFQAAETNREHLRLTARGIAEQQALLYTSSRGTGLDVAFAALARLSPSRSGDYVRRGWDALIRSRALVLDEVGQRARLVEGAGDVVDVAKRLEAARSRLSNLLLHEASGDPEKELLARSREEVEQIERELAARSATFRSSRDRAAIGWDQVVSGLPSGAALVSYATYAQDGRRALLAFVVGVDRVPRVAPLGSADEIDRLTARWRSLAATPPVGGRRDQSLAETACRQAGQALRVRIWDPLERFLVGSNLVLIVPDGVLHLISFVALPATQKGGYLIDSPYAIHYLSAERDVVVGGEALSRGTGMLALGGASFDSKARLPSTLTTSVAYRGLPESRSHEIREALLQCEGLRKMRFQALPGTVTEIDSVTKLWGSRDEVTVLEGQDAGERAVKELLPGKRVAHFATHGFFLDRPCGGLKPVAGDRRAIGGIDTEEITPPAPGLSANPFLLAGLALAGANQRATVGPDEEDGILTAEEIVSLDLAGLDWVVLSACDTGLGDVRSGDGVLGLRRAFEIAGAGTLIMSLWSVEDQSARDWMSRLYAGRFRRNLETAEALREADQGALESLRAQGKSTHPFYWAGFVAAGGWR
jgi:CHAT domain-containing protein